MNTDPQTFRHRSEEVEAVQWTGDNADTLRAFAGPDFDTIDLDDRTEDPDETAAVRESEHGTWRGLKPGDWVVRLDGGLYEFAAADFAKQYEPAPSAAVPPADRAGLRDRIRRAVCEAEGFAWDSDMLEPDEYGDVADMVLAALLGPIPAGTDTATWTAIRAIQLMNEAGRERDAAKADRVAVLREAADRIAAMPEAQAGPLQKGITWTMSELRRVADNEPASSVAAPERAALSARLWAVAEHHIIAEWICCEPCEPGHTLCAKGHAALGMAKSLLVDADPEKAWNPEAPLLNAVLAEMDQLRRERDLAIAHDRQPYPTAWAYEQACKALRTHRLALSDALGLGTSAPWDAIRERAAELAGQAVAGGRAAVLREAADAVAADTEIHIRYGSATDYAERHAGLLRRLAAETPGPETQGALMRAHVALAEQAGRDQATLARVRQLHDNLDAKTDLTSPDDEITRGAAAQKIAAALDGWTAPEQPKRPPMDPVRILGIAACPTPLTHNWGCGCPTDQAPAAFEADPASKTSPKAASKAEPVHARPVPDDSGISPCCGRPPFEFRGERLTRDPAAVTCRTPPAAVAEPGKEG